MFEKLVFLIMIAFYIPASANTVLAEEHHLEEHIVDKFGVEFAQNYFLACLTHDRMWELFPRSAEGELLYPAYYGGHFFCDKGRFVFAVVEPLMEDAKSGIFSNLFHMDGIDVRAVEFSYKELISTRDAICNYVSNNPDSNMKITTWGIDFSNNIVVVYLHELTAETEAEFRREVVDSPMIKLQQGNPVGVPVAKDDNETGSADVAHLQPGVRIYVGSYGFSAGYPAARGQAAGFVTALHGLPLDGDDVRLGSSSGQVVGEVTGPIRFEGPVDGAFVVLSQSDIDRSADSLMLLYNGPRPSQGMILASVSTPPNGVMRTQRNIVVTNAHFSANMGGGLVLTDMIQTNGHAVYGESGGLVFRPAGSEAQVKGVIVGSEIGSATGENMFFSWWEEINRTINVTQP
ncbi:MAG: S1 family peptidase [Firmicutes bacterium]|nr:S1 family peptidase [Bacillota bacterium]